MNDQRTKVFLDRYALKDKNGDPVETTVQEMWTRVANSIGTTADERAAFLSILDDFKFVPGGRILSGAGAGTQVTFYNCYVIPIETKARRYNGPDDIGMPDPGSDSREAILDTMSTMVDIMSRGGGVGINWSVLRPKGTHLSKVNGTTSGPISWMDVASHAVQTVTQGGSRRGAAMFMLDDWHPDLMEFIDAKRNLDKITGANVSVAVSDKFMECLEKNAVWRPIFPKTDHPAYDTDWDGDIDKWTEKFGNDSFQTFPELDRPAREIWHAIAEAAWHNGEPGVVFLDRYNKMSTAGETEHIIAVNPCGEQGLGAYSVCNLGSMNLDAYIIYKKSIAPYGVPKVEFNWAKFIEDSETAVTFLDNVIDKNFYFLPENEFQQKRLRRIGLGVMGLADAMLALGMRYGSKESIEFTDRIFSSLKVAALRRSCVLAQQKGVAPAWDRSMLSRPYFRDIFDTPLGVQIRKFGLRNLFLLTQAPTGSTSILAGVNSGIEPYFAFEYTRTDRTGTHKVYASAVEKYHIEGTKMGREWVTAEDVSVEGHIAVQAAVQRHVDSSVSKTINAPNGHTVEDTEKAFTLAYRSGLKGLAYFRDGNGRDQVLTREEPKSAVVGPKLEELQRELDVLYEQLAAVVPELIEYRRPDYLAGSTQKVATRAGTAYVTVNRDEDDGRPVEVFFNVGKAGSEVAAMAEAMGRLASLALRKGANLGGVANQLEGVGGTAQFNKSIPHAISQALTKENARRTVFPEGQEDCDDDGESEDVVPVGAPEVELGRLDLCPECDNLSLSRQEGCSKCALCGFSAC